MHDPAEPLDGNGKAPGEAGRVHGSGVGSEQASADASGVDDGRRLARREQRVAVAHAVALVNSVATPEPAQLWLVRREVDGTALGESAVDPLALYDGADLVDGVMHFPGPSRPPRPVGGAFEGGQRRGLVADAPAAVAARCSEAGDLPLDHHHAEVRVGAQQVVGRPQPGEARADDGHVGVGIARQRRARLEAVIRRQRVMPVREWCHDSASWFESARRSRMTSHHPNSRCKECVSRSRTWGRRIGSTSTRRRTAGLVRRWRRRGAVARSAR